MEALIIQSTKDTPQVNFEPQAEMFSISEKSLPENAIEFYQPIFTWLDEYSQTPNQSTMFDFKLNYFNTASAKQIAKILLLLEKLSEKSEVKIRWYYEKRDTDMLTTGLRYAKLINVTFDFIEY